MLDLDDVDEMFRVIHRWCSQIPDYPAHQVEMFLGAGDWTTSLATIADVCLDTKTEMPDRMFLIYKTLAESFHLGEDQYFPEIGEFLTERSGRNLPETGH